MTAFLKKNPAAETAAYFALWYYLNIQFNIINKQIYNYFPYPWFVSAVHLAVGLLIMTFFLDDEAREIRDPGLGVHEGRDVAELPARVRALPHERIVRRGRGVVHAHDQDARAGVLRGGCVSFNSFISLLISSLSIAARARRSQAFLSSTSSVF